MCGHKPINEIQEFNSEDWDAFNGAEEWPDGALPLICEGKKATLVVDSKAVVIFVHCAEDPDRAGTTWSMPIPFRSQTIARLLAEHLPFDDKSPAYYSLLGFDREDF